MPIVTISRGSYSRGAEVARIVAEKMGYEIVAREVLLEASDKFNIPEVKLVNAVHDAPSFLERFTHGRERYVAFIRAALLRRLRHDNVVYHGLAGHFFVRDVPHVLSVRILADMAARIEIVKSRDHVDAKEAQSILSQDDEERRKWSRQLYGIDTWDPCLYDMVLHVKRMDAADAAALICRALELDCFRTTAESQQKIEDLALAAEVNAVIFDLKPDARVTASSGEVEIAVKERMVQMDALVREIEGRVLGVQGVRTVRVEPEFRV